MSAKNIYYSDKYTDEAYEYRYIKIFRIKDMGFKAFDKFLSVIIVLAL